MKIFCKHDYVMKIVKDIAPIDYEVTKNGYVVNSRTKIGCVVYCKKCGKEKKGLAKKIRNLYANSIKEEEQERIMKEVITTTTLPEEFCYNGE